MPAHLNFTRDNESAAEYQYHGRIIDPSCVYNGHSYSVECIVVINRIDDGIDRDLTTSRPAEKYFHAPQFELLFNTRDLSLTHNEHEILKIGVKK